MWRNGYPSVMPHFKRAREARYTQRWMKNPRELDMANTNRVSNESVIIQNRFVAPDHGCTCHGGPGITSFGG
jgi:hypothetical protein